MACKNFKFFINYTEIIVYKKLSKKRKNHISQKHLFNTEILKFQNTFTKMFLD